MKDTVPVSVLIAARNEEKNIRKCLTSAAPAAEVIVIDSHSSDKTAHISESEFGARVVQFDYHGGYPKKRQWLLDNFEFANEWLILLDADEVIPASLWTEIEAALANPQHSAYLVRKGFHFLGKRFRFGGFSHQAVFLLRAGKGRFEQLVQDSSEGMDMEVHERVQVDGSVGVLRTPLVHEDFKGLEAYLARHNQYSTWEARLRFENSQRNRYGEQAIKASLFGNAQQRRRFMKYLVVHLPFEPMVWFVYHYLLCLGFLEGRRGFIACRIRAGYIAQVRYKLYEMKMAANHSSSP